MSRCARLLVHSRSGVTDETKAFALVQAEKQGAEVSAAAAGRSPAAHDHVQGFRGLQLDPILTARADVDAIDALSDNSFEIFCRANSNNSLPCSN